MKPISTIQLTYFRAMDFRNRLSSVLGLSRMPYLAFVSQSAFWLLCFQNGKIHRRST
jgi:hypothetical protein